MKKMNKSRRRQSERDRLAHESPEDFGTPYRSASDWSLAARDDASRSEELHIYQEDYNGDEDFYGDDEENQSGYPSYTGKQDGYLGSGDWVDRRYGERQFKSSRRK